MPKKNRKVDSKEVGLELGLMVFKFFLKSEYLHYGYFKDGLETDIQNLKQAQENYTQLLLESIPGGTKSILDVGCGSGKTASTLISNGYSVDCVSPGTILTNYAANLLGDQATIYNTKFEDIKEDKKYDLILFSESFQYIPLSSSIENALQRLNDGGHIMICDFFKTEAPGKSYLGGGHRFTHWQETMEQYKSKISLVKELDITKETAPTIDLVNQLSNEVFAPVSKSVWAVAEDRFPLLIKIINWKYKKKFQKMRKKHLEGQRTGENFIKHKKYMFYLFQKS